MRTWLSRLRLVARIAAVVTPLAMWVATRSIERALLGFVVVWTTWALAEALWRAWRARTQMRHHRHAMRSMGEPLANGARALHGSTFRPAAVGPCYVADPSGAPVRVDVPDGVLEPGRPIWAFGRLERVIDGEAPEVPREGGYRESSVTEVWMLRGAPAVTIWNVSPERHFRARARVHGLHAATYAGISGLALAVSPTGEPAVAVGLALLALWLPHGLKRRALVGARKPFFGG